MSDDPVIIFLTVANTVMCIMLWFYIRALWGFWWATLGVGAAVTIGLTI